MPIYEYACSDGHTTTKIHDSWQEYKPTIICDECGKPANRTWSGGQYLLWYDVKLKKKCVEVHHIKKPKMPDDPEIRGQMVKARKKKEERMKRVREYNKDVQKERDKYGNIPQLQPMRV